MILFAGHCAKRLLQFAMSVLEAGLCLARLLVLLHLDTACSQALSPGSNAPSRAPWFVRLGSSHRLTIAVYFTGKCCGAVREHIKCDERQDRAEIDCAADRRNEPPEQVQVGICDGAQRPDQLHRWIGEPGEHQSADEDSLIEPKEAPNAAGEHRLKNAIPRNQCSKAATWDCHAALALIFSLLLLC